MSNKKDSNRQFIQMLDHVGNEISKDAKFLSKEMSTSLEQRQELFNLFNKINEARHKIHKMLPDISPFEKK